MLPEFISITNLQRQLKNVFSSKTPIRIVLSNNAISGIVISAETAKLLLDSGVIDQLREELWELNDKETRDLVIRSRKGKTKPVPFDSFAKKYGV